MKIYLVTGYSRESYNNSRITLDAFTSKELAQKCANGFDDVTDYLLSVWEIKQAERDEKLSNVSDEEYDEKYEEKVESIYEEYEKYECWDTYYYSVDEIEVIE